MKFNLIIFINLFFLCLIESFSQQTIFIKYNNTVSISEIERKINHNEFTKVASRNLLNLPDYRIGFFANGLAKNIESLNRIVKVEFTANINSDALISLLHSDSEIEFAEIAKTYQIHSLPNDSLVNQQWALSKINAFNAWNISSGKPEILLAIIDTGIDYNHPDLKNKLFLNTGENGLDLFGNDKRNNGIDDDGNGFIDDFMGWDFTDRFGFPFDSTAGDYLDWDNNPFDDNGHGTYIAGIAVAQTNNSIGIAGAAPNIKVLNIRSFDPNGYGEEDDAAAALLYAVQMNAKVVNMSFGDNSFSLVFRDVIRYAYSQNVVLVASAGNSGSSSPHYPSGYSEVLSVGNSTINDAVAPSSNWGSSLDLVAPGTNILTTARNNNYISINGTSASAPFVSATACLILSKENFTNEEVKQILKSTTDDIGEAGWDLRSGAGRLNMFRALSVLAPSIIKFEFPKMDYTTFSDTLNVVATILSSYFKSFNLEFGVGFNPSNWTILIKEGLSQFSRKNIFTLNLTNLKDSTYTLRIKVNLNNGRTLEERVHFHINRTAPEVELISLVPCYFGDKITILSAVYTNEPSIVRLYFKPKNSHPKNFNFITLDGFTINNQFVKQLHYGFIPKNLVENNKSYDVYLEAENLAGLKTIVKDRGDFFSIELAEKFQLSSFNFLDFDLPAGNLYQYPLSILSSEDNEVILREKFNQRISKIYSFNNSTFKFEVRDSIVERIIKDHGDFNGNGRLDLLTLFIRDGFILEQDNVFSPKFSQKFSKTGGVFWPILAKDIDADGKTEILAVKNDSTISVWEIPLGQSLIPEEKTTLINFSRKWIGQNRINSPNAIILDSNSDGKNEIWFIDEDGDLFSYIISGDNIFIPDKIISTEFLGNSAYLTHGDFDGNGKDEIAILLHSIEKFDIAPYYRLIIFNLINNNINILFDYHFIDAAKEFNNAFRKAENALRFSDLDNDGKQELILFTFPYAYILKFINNKVNIIGYFENINSNSILISDFNKNGIKELSLPKDDKIRFIELSTSGKLPIPIIIESFSPDSSLAKLVWKGEGNKFQIYRGDKPEELSPYKIVTESYFIDSNLTNGRYYYYAVQSINQSSPNLNSALSNVKEIYVKNITKIKSVRINKRNNLLVEFSEKIRTTVDNLQSFHVIDFGYPKSISPFNQNTYLLSFDNQLPLGINRLVIQDLVDLYNAPIKKDTITFTVDEQTYENYLYISNSTLINPYLIKLEFNLNLDEKSALTIDNYTFTPVNLINKIYFDDNRRNIIYIDLNGGKPIGSVGIEYVLKLNNITSDSSSGLLKIKEGAGSYVVFNKNLDNLSNLYIYPNPIKTNSHNHLTFANLTKRTKIQILDLNGNLLNEFETINNSGGANFDLTDKNNNKLGSGIYIYRVISLDDSRNEIETKIGKFAVIR